MLLRRRLVGVVDVFLRVNRRDFTLHNVLYIMLYKLQLQKICNKRFFVWSHSRWPWKRFHCTNTAFVCLV